MSVKIGSARSSYGNTSAGDQSGGKEVSTQSWYLHSKGWFVLRAKDKSKADKIAVAMEHACANDKIGYDQSTRNTLFKAVQDKGYDPARCTSKVNTDCSALVRVCCHYAGITCGDFITSTLGTKLMATGQFDKLTESKYCKQPDYLERGDILCTLTKGHVVVVLSNGDKAGTSAPKKPALTVAPGTWNVRRKPELTGAVVDHAHGGDKLYIIDVTSNGWYHVSMPDGMTGYISPKAVISIG